MNKKNNSKGIYWLASYPKSGNTWTRSFIKAMRGYQRLKKGQKLTSLVKDECENGEPILTEEGLVDINALNTGSIASARQWVEQIIGFDLADLNTDEIDLLRPDAYLWYANQMQGLAYHKIHDAYTYLPSGKALIPQEATLGALCIIRNPLDVAISFANHSSCSIDESIIMMGNPDYGFCASRKSLPNQLRQWLLTWSDHVSSWTQAPDLNRLIVRYEDMKENQLPTFTKIAKFLQLPSDKTTIKTVLEHIKIEKFQAQENERGFNEKAAKVKNFFRKGIVGDWQQTLTDQQINRIISDHHVVMQKFGYLNDKNQPTELIMRK